jgi:hypothetical protein
VAQQDKLREALLAALTSEFVHGQKNAVSEFCDSPMGKPLRAPGAGQVAWVGALREAVERVRRAAAAGGAGSAAQTIAAIRAEHRQFSQLSQMTSLLLGNGYGGAQAPPPPVNPGVNPWANAPVPTQGAQGQGGGGTPQGSLGHLNAEAAMDEAAIDDLNARMMAQAMAASAAAAPAPAPASGWPTAGVGVGAPAPAATAAATPAPAAAAPPAPAAGDSDDELYGS